MNISKLASSDATFEVSGTRKTIISPIYPIISNFKLLVKLFADEVMHTLMLRTKIHEVQQMKILEIVKFEGRKFQQASVKFM